MSGVDSAQRLSRARSAQEIVVGAGEVRIAGAVIEVGMPDRDGAHCGDHEGAAGVQTAPSPTYRTESQPRGTGDRRTCRLIICAGMPRAGSTLQYNLVRLLAERYLEGIAGGWVETYDAFAEKFPDYGRPGAKPLRPLIIKTHQFDPRYAALVDPPGCGHTFHIYRDVRDALVSFTRRFGGTLDENIERWTARWVEWAEHWSRLVNLTISRYEAIMREPHREAVRYGRALGIQVSDAEIDEIIEACSQPRMRARSTALRTGQREEYDQEYLVHPGHVADGRWGRWQQDMTPAQREAVWSGAGLWLEEHGYPEYGQLFGEPIPAEVAGIPSVDLAPPGVPKMRPPGDPLVIAFGRALVAPSWPRNSRDAGGEGRARTFYGDTLNILPGEMVSTELAVRAYFEEGLTWGLLQCLRPGDTFLDVGAHVGYFTLLGARLVGSTGRVEAFEPTPQTAAVLRSNAQGLPQVTVNELAVFSRSGPLILNDLGSEYAAYNSVHAPRLEGPEASAPARQLTVQALTLDDFCQERGLRPDFIKIDAESTELNVLQGAVGVLAEAQPIISVEVGDCGVTGAASSREVLEFAIGLEYRAYEYKAFGQFVPHEPKQWYSYDNLLLLPPTRWQPRQGAGWSEGEPARLLHHALGRQEETIRQQRKEYQALQKRCQDLRRQWHDLQEEHRRRMHADGALHAAYLRMIWECLGRRYARVALFGAGKFARRLVSQAALMKSGPRIVRLLDDAAQPGQTLDSIPVVRPERDALSGMDAVVVATDVPDSPLHRRCVEACASSVPVVNLYEGIAGGPFPTAEWLNS